MSVLTTIFVGLGLAGTVGACAVREHRLIRSSRLSLLDRCASVVAGAEIRHGGDGFPTLVGWHSGQRMVLDLIPDTMVLRRLPQLWASVTLLNTLTDVPSLAILVRPAGYEFYSLTNRLTFALETPATFPQEVLIRGADARAQVLLEQLSAQLAASLADPRIKEIAITDKGLRIVAQVGEGRRGEHLLLRQAVFDDAGVRPSELTNWLKQLDALRSTIEGREWKLAA